MWNVCPTVDREIITPFFNLEELHCTCNEALFGARIATRLSRRIQLKTLTVIWNDSWPEILLALHGSLKIVRLYSEHYSTVMGLNTQLMSYASITTLALYALGGTQALVKECLARCHFPGLRELTVRCWLLEPLSVFQFIHKHPTLLEVNIDTSHRRHIRIELLLRLIDGTGTWFDPANDGSIPKFTMQSHYNGNDIERWTRTTMAIPGFPGFIPGCDITCSNFAFKRAPIDLHRPLWKSHNGSWHPRYRCTALALADLTTTEEDMGDASPRMIRALREITLAVPDLEELRLQINSREDLGRYMMWLVSS